MSEPSWIGRKLSNRYEIEDLLGAGGMSSVFRADDPNLRRAVAIKLIHPHLSSDPQFVSRFEEEAVSVAQLRHPNIIQVHDFAHDGDTYYMVLEFVPGETLEERMKRLNAGKRRLSTKDAVNIIASICDALEYAHKRGMVHRDIKPANIMLNLQGQSILMDFGIAKIVGGKQHTATGAVVGTALYMAPEIIRGEVADHRVDIYSLGVTLFETLTGKRPFEAASAMTTLMMHINDPVPDINEINPDVPASIVAIVVKAMSKDKNDRYQSAAEFATALRSANLSAPTKTSVTPAAGLAGTMVENTPIAKSAGVAGTMIEEAPAAAASNAAGTMIESAPPADSLNVAGTMIESAPPAASLNVSGTMIEERPVNMPPVAKTTTPPPPVNHPPPKAKTAKGGFPFKWVGLGAVGILLVCSLAFFALKSVISPQPTATLIPPTLEIIPTVPEVTATFEPTATLEPPTATPEPTVIPTATLPPGPQVRITSIILDGSTYEVAYETYEYTEVLPGMHVHFYFNNFTQSQVGAGGGGSWAVYGGPRPFRKFTTSNRPADATQMCAIVANPNHTVILDTGNCVDLP